MLEIFNSFKIILSEMVWHDNLYRLLLLGDMHFYAVCNTLIWEKNIMLLWYSGVEY